MEIRWLNAKDYDELLGMLNSVFANKYGRDMDFLNEQPKMWVRDDRHMEKHLGVFEDGVLAAVIGIYPLPLRVGDEVLLFATTGNVATRPEYEGRGYFTLLFDRLMKELEDRGFDAARLGGSRTRYGRFGFEPTGTQLYFTMNESNRLKGLGNLGGDIEFKEIERDDLETLSYVRRLYESAPLFVERSSEDGERDLYLSLCTKHSTPYIALREGKPIGYLSAYADGQFVGKSVNGRHISEYRVESGEDPAPMLCAWQRVVGKDITFTVSPLQKDACALMCAKTEEMVIKSPSHFRILSIEKIANALIKVKCRSERIPDLGFTLGIEGYGNLYISVKDGEGECLRSHREADLTVSRSEAARILFGYNSHLVHPALPAALRAVLPLPLIWDDMNYV